MPAVAKPKREKGAASSPSTPVFTEVQPNAGRTIQALREMGYDSFSSIMDLIDNSLDAGAKKVTVTIKEVGEDRIVDILDDGKGMDAATLAEALKLGSNVESYDPTKRLGKFGMGLITASISLAKNIWVLSRVKGQAAHEATFDVDTIERENRFVITLKPADSKRVLETVDEHGTIVRLSRIDRINDTNVARFAQNLRARLGQVYRHFLEKGVAINVNGRLVERYDPLMLSHPETEKVLDTTLDLGDGTKAKLVAVELPDLGTEGDAAANIYPHNSGFYVVRNNREIIAGDTFGFYRHHHSYSHFRAELSYTGNSTALHEDIKKASVHPDDKLLDKLRGLTEKLIADSGRRSRESADAVPVKMTHKTAAEAINAKMALLISGPTKATIAAAKEAAINPPAPVVEESKTPGKRGRPSKEEAEKRKAAEAKAEAEKLAAPPAPTVEFVEADLGNESRFFQAEQKDLKTIITYNNRHPFILWATESKQPKVNAVLGMVAFALSKAEGDNPEGKKLVNRACDYLAVLAAPNIGG
jgi:hypothetical protein